MWRLPVAYWVVVGGLCAAVVSTLDPGAAELRAIIRLTAFTSSLVFLPVFVASALHRRWPSAPSRWLLANRRYVGLSVAASHFWHLVAILALFSMSSAARASTQTTTLVFGTAGFVLLGLMAATSNDASQRALGRAWRGLHTLGVYVLWIDFTFTYVGTAGRSPFHAVMAAIFGAAVALRASAWAMPRRALAPAA